ncbi:MAG TPA: copper transporter [Actinomycetota bacterium]|nr:copper transporter [Actinomycetota bacterium]
MISFRYHLITIVAIFLALGLGLLAGTTVVDQSLVSNLRNTTEILRSDLRDQRAEAARYQAQVGAAQEASNILPVLDPGLLAGVPVVLVAGPELDGAVLSITRDALDEARANLLGVLSLTDRMAAIDETSRRALAKILGAPADTTPEVLQRMTAQTLSQRLTSGLPRRGAQPAQDDVLDQLLTENFLTSPGITKDDVQAIGGRDQVVVVLAGGPTVPVVSPDRFLVPLVGDLVARGTSVAAGESTTTSYPFVETLRADGSPADGTRMVTVDDLDLSIGGAALVLGLEHLMFAGQGGNYGVKGSPTDVRPIPPLT